MRKQLRATSIVILLTLFNAGCMSWSRLGTTPHTDLRGVQPTQVVRVWRYDGTYVFLKRAGIRNDTLWGLQARDSTSIPVSSIVSVQVRRIDSLRTSVLLLGAAIVFGGILASVGGDERLGF